MTAPLLQGPNSIEKYWLELWLEKSLEFWLEIPSLPPIRKCSKVGSLDTKRDLKLFFKPKLKTKIFLLNWVPVFSDVP